LTKIRNFATICLVALLVVYCGAALLTSVYTTVNAEESTFSGSVLLSRKSATRPGFIALGDPINDPRPH